jgi:hypothetical protein
MIELTPSSSTGEEVTKNIFSNINNSTNQCSGNISSKRYKNLVECYPCFVDDCQILFSSQLELDNHKETHHQLYKCQYPGCNKNFMKLENLRKHKKNHLKAKKNFYCPYEGCNKCFASSYSVYLHYKIHTGIMPYRCEICEKKFFNKNNWQYHIKNMHKKLSVKKLGCKHINCGHKSKSVKQLLMHHDKLDIECVKEKNLLLQLIIFYQNASINLLENNENYLSNKFKENFGVDDEQNIWINYINNYDLDNELKNESELIELQSKKVIENSINKNQYKGILENF